MIPTPELNDEQTIEVNDDHPIQAPGDIEVSDDKPIEDSEAASDGSRLQLEQLKAENERLKTENQRLAAENADLLSHLSQQSAIAATQDFSESGQGLMFEEHAIEEAMLSPTATSPALTATTMPPASSSSAVEPCPASTTPCEHWQLLSAYGDLYCIGRETLELTWQTRKTGSVPPLAQRQLEWLETKSQELCKEIRAREKRLVLPSSWEKHGQQYRLDYLRGTAANVPKRFCNMPEHGAGFCNVHRHGLCNEPKHTNVPRPLAKEEVAKNRSEQAVKEAPLPPGSEMSLVHFLAWQVGTIGFVLASKYLRP